MRFDILTLFPGMFESYLRESILKRAQDGGKIEIGIWNIRDYSTDKHHTTDDSPFGGGAGMVLKPEPIADALEAVRRNTGAGRTILLSPRGCLFTQEIARRLASNSHLILLCGRYEGVDERVSTSLVDEEISIGDYVLSGGELAALVVLESVARLLPGVLGAADGPLHDSFTEGLLEHPQYTRPREFGGHSVPDVLLDGDHKKIEAWRRQQSLIATARTRPDLLPHAHLTDEDVAFLREQGYEVLPRKKG
ncbi:MAG: tRNA (guanosine(37)-N1)-methyltransferase TrmD [Nitrospirae bacterium]|nr:tRNA (guanosine(37)-N1)-methyltransferase TrmD [Nitrospirota bacterium]